jgi:hypothetical protein
MLSEAAAATCSLRNVLADFPGVTVLRAEAAHALVTMDSATADRLKRRYPFLEVEEDLRHHQAARLG